MEELRETLAATESLAARWAAQRMTGERLRTQQANVQESEKEIPAQRTAILPDFDAIFHRILVEVTGSVRLDELGRGLRHRMLPFDVESLQRLQTALTAVEGNKRPLAGLRQGGDGGLQRRLPASGRRERGDPAQRLVALGGANESGAAAMTRLSMHEVTKRFGEVAAVAELSLSVNEGESMVLLGPSGCGKTTTLRLLAGFERPDSGSIRVGPTVVADDHSFVPPERRRMSVVFQNYALWPHMTVYDNVAFGPQLRKVRDIGRKVQDMLDLVQLGGYGDRYPHQLSGGQQQRVALARALANDPPCLLLDEPISNLDTQLREEMRFELKRIQRLLGLTMVYVTHDQTEALSLADRIAVMNGGCIEQLGSPQELYRRPRTRFVAAALGAANFVSATLLDQSGDRAHVSLLGGHAIETGAPREWRAGKRGDCVLVSVRPPAIHLEEPGEGPRGVIEETLFFGDFVQYAVRCLETGEPLRVTGAARCPATVGDEVGLRIDPELTTVLDEAVSPGQAGSVSVEGEHVPEVIGGRKS